ncbi:hypothetical protein [Anaerovibrio lipolyticus]|uniref:hypothetical protein n=1 Tax=Anaerovibrio lipolyticus TaxID=82374 RepID=UPI0004861873|nr:hypothetical protein [Anaerovibrio lipolyticus]
MSMKRYEQHTESHEKFGHREFINVNGYELHDEEHKTYAALYGLRFYRTVQLIKDGREFHLVDILDDASSYFAFGKLCKNLNLANQVVIDTSISRGHWKLAKTLEDLATVCGVSVDTIKKIMKKWKKANAVAKVNINGSISYAVNPLYYSVSKGYQLSLPMINAFYASIREQIKSPETLEELDYLLSEYNSPVNARKEVSSDAEAQEILMADIAEEARMMRHDDIFTEYVLDGKVPLIWHEEKWNKDGKECSGYFVGKAAENEFFTPNSIQLEDERGKGRKASNVTAVRNLYIDIDAGKDAEGNYLSLTEVAERKAAMKKVMATLPAPTATAETRNGFHLYWSISKEDQTDIERGKALLKKLVRTVSIADKAASDISRLLRLPGSIHHKNGLEPFQVNIMEANAVRYSFDDIEAYLDNNIASIEAACQLYTEKYPEALQKISLKEKSKVIQFPKTPLYNELRGSDNDVEKCHSISMRNFLADMGYDAWGTKFKCVLPLHGDENGDANIYDKDGAGQAYDVYVCHCSECSEKGLDIIGLVRAMYSCSFKEAVSFLLDYAESLDKNIA